MAKSNILSYRKIIILLLILVVISPIFGVILADIVGYHEPLDIAAEALNLHDITEEHNWTPLIDYTVPGLPSEIGYIIAGLIGIAIILGIGILISKFVEVYKE